MILLALSLLLAAVGGLGLMGTMSLNVLERTREIGVMRAIGASDRIVLQVIMVEGIVIGLIGWAIGALVALPFSRVLSDMLGIGLMSVPFNYTFSAGAVGLWLVLAMALSAVSSFMPARHASRVTVRDELAYE